MIDTLFFCFICDEEMYSGKQRLAEADIHDFMDKFGKEAVKEGDKLDVRARNHLKDEDENENEENAETLLRREEADRNARLYKALNIDDGTSDNGGDLTGRGGTQNKPAKKEAAEVDFKGLNLVYVQDKINYDDEAEEEDEDEDEDEDEEEEDEDEDEDEDDNSPKERREAKERASSDNSELKGLAGRFKAQPISTQKNQTFGQIGLQGSFNTKVAMQKQMNPSGVSDNTKVSDITKGSNNNKVSDHTDNTKAIKAAVSRKSEDGDVNMGIFGMKKGQDSDLSEDEEDLEINTDKKEITKQGQKQNFLF